MSFVLPPHADSPLLPLSGLKHFRYGCVQSTQTIARALAQSEGSDEEFVVSADAQSAGKGRMGRAWQSPSGSLSMSLVLRGDISLIGSLAYIVGLGIYESVQELAFAQQKQRKLILKWPNDLLLESAKCCGILISYHESPKPIYVIGIGMNILESPINMPYAVTDLRQQGLEVSAEEMLPRVTSSVLSWRAKALQQGVESIYDSWQKKSHPIGTQLIARTPVKELEGEFMGLHNDGSLLLRLASGKIEHILSADRIVKNDR